MCRIVCLVAVLIVSMAHTGSVGQQIPAHVKYKRAPEAVNKKALKFLNKLIAGDQPKKELLRSTSNVLICGPELWSAIKGVAPKILQNAMPITYISPMADGVHKYYGKGFKTPAQQVAFWYLVQIYLDKYRLIPKNRPKRPMFVRKANENELAYYWSLISYSSIDEPFYIVAIDDKSMLFDFMIEKGEPKVFTIDLAAKMVRIK